ncbi:MAG: deoxyribose-phosphate aldolase [Candidatus Pacebacteria bacterium]|jgi:deoxyribose-phosphate aldolase|nr:deoxyribose-phosphate aldolase [Candidatus Paceibacterota bacterium]MDD3072097.1 deoxyribose-phosphate aldolase [Candidatus Paceibacterota bacterium]MDD3728838.1 deoxyribose-phosphate aldolase [Candidatus Paceibacterota bacterium]MDD4201303.1 deoxyribose-phosphate aldolase [Candidatus Paceibacterota bacterium]MDD4897116.1 deoxyribose-phosphate aldolase [Candidatus Paceibacterota bacterium]
MKNIAKIIDHTDIRKEATLKDIKNICLEAKEYGFHGVCVREKWTKTVSKELKGTDIKTVVLADSPMGLSRSSERIKLAKKIKKDGGNELDIVLNIVDIKYGRYEKVLNDLKNICRIMPTKVIIGSGYLTDDEIIKASQIVKKAGAICVKTATEKDPLENREMEEKARHLKLMKKGAPGLLIKASGNIRTLKDAEKMVKAGADIIGTSSGVKMAKEFKK